MNESEQDVHPLPRSQGYKCAQGLVELSGRLPQLRILFSNTYGNHA